MNRCILFIVALWFLSAIPCSGLMDDYLPVGSSQTGDLFPLIHDGKITPEKLLSSIPVGVSGAKFLIDSDENIVMFGDGLNGKKWKVVLGKYFGDSTMEVFHGDLDKNGIVDVVFTTYTYGNGSSPSHHLWTVMFDSDGMPIPFEADCYLTEQDKEVSDIYVLDEDGKATLVYMNLDQGYWITSLYKAEDSTWQRVDGVRNGTKFPAFTRYWENRPCHEPSEPIEGRNPFTPDLSNKTPNLVGKLKSLKWANIQSSEDISLNIVDSKGTTHICKPNSWYSRASIIIDSKWGREIVKFEADENSVKNALQKILNGNFTVKLYGHSDANQESPEMIWAIPNWK